MQGKASRALSCIDSICPERRVVLPLSLSSRLVIVGQPAGYVDVKDNPSPDAGDDGGLEDPASISRIILLARSAHQGLDSGIGASELDCEGVNAQSFLTRRRCGRSRIRGE